jgi:hypothetical protein
MWLVAGAIAAVFITLWVIAEFGAYLVLRAIDDDDGDLDW